MWGDERKEEEEWDADGARWRVGIRRAEKADVCATLAEDRVGDMGSLWTAENELSERRRGPMRAKVSEELLTTSHAGERPGDGVFEYAEREIDVLEADRMNHMETRVTTSMWS